MDRRTFIETSIAAAVLASRPAWAVEAIKSIGSDCSYTPCGTS